MGNPAVTSPEDRLALALSALGMFFILFAVATIHFRWNPMTAAGPLGMTLILMAVMVYCAAGDPE